MINPANTIQREEQHNPLELLSHLLDTVMPIDMKEFELNEEQTLEVEKLIEKLEENEDVQNIFHTMSSSSD